MASYNFFSVYIKSNLLCGAVYELAVSFRYKKYLKAKRAFVNIGLYIDNYIESLTSYN